MLTVNVKFPRIYPFHRWYCLINIIDGNYRVVPDSIQGRRGVIGVRSISSYTWLISARASRSISYVVSKKIKLSMAVIAAALLEFSPDHDAEVSRYELKRHIQEV